MKAPDKIYIHTKENPLWITWSEEKEENCTNEEYIRKGALLEWAKSEIEKDENILTLEDLINKINSL